MVFSLLREKRYQLFKFMVQILSKIVWSDISIVEGNDCHGRKIGRFFVERKVSPRPDCGV
jgi:hypothetical protein